MNWPWYWTPGPQIWMKSRNIFGRGHTNPPKSEMTSWNIIRNAKKNTLNVSKKLKRIVVITTCCRHKATKHNKNGNHVVKCKKMYCKLTWCGLGGNNCSYYDQLLKILISKGYHPHELALIFTPVAQILMKSYRICKRGHTNPPKLQMSSWKFVRMAEKQNAYIKNPKIWASKRAKVVAH